MVENKYRNNIYRTANSLFCVLICSACAAHAAITDADFAKVARLIQEGRRSRAKAEITILLDDNPNDPNAPKLRKILESLGGGANPAHASGNPPADTTHDNSPSMQETIAWIGKNIYATHSVDTRGDTWDHAPTEESLVALEVRDGWLNIAIKRVIEEHAERGNTDFANDEVTKVYLVYRVAFKDLHLGGSTSSRRAFLAENLRPGASLISESGLQLDFKSKNLAVQRSEFRLQKKTTRYWHPFSVDYSYRINFKETSEAAYLSAEVIYERWLTSSGDEQFDVPQGLAWQTKGKTTGISIPVSEELAERMKNALNHLIELSGGGEKPKEAF